jgi:putative hydrolase
VSDHAFSTLKENVEIAKKKGLEMICMTDHAPEHSDGAKLLHFYAQKWLPRTVDGIKLMFGIEGDILDDNKLDVDFSDFVQGNLSMEVVIASMHYPLYHSKTKADHTETWLEMVKNPFVDILGHSGDPRFEYDHEPVIRAAKEYDKCIEINNHSFAARAGANKICPEIAKMCKKIGTKIVVGSDAHCCWEIGSFDYVTEMLEEIEFPKELIVSRTADTFTKYIEGRKHIKIEDLSNLKLNS